jgi:hypothetical protein
LRHGFTFAILQPAKARHGPAQFATKCSILEWAGLPAATPSAGVSFRRRSRGAAVVAAGPLAFFMEGASLMNPTHVAPSQAALTLRHSPIPALRHLSVEESDTQVVLSGQVPSYYMKQLAQETIMPYLDRRQLLNHVVVERK